MSERQPRPARPLNIAVFGWYHHQNAGDDRIAYCLTRWLEGNTLMFLPAGRPPPLSLLRTCDAAIIGGGGIATSRSGVFREMSRWVRSASIPVALAGISIEADDRALDEEIRRLLDVAVFAWFRDQGSLLRVGEHEHAFVAPDVTWLEPYEPSGESAGAGIAVGLRRESTLPVDAWVAALRSLGQHWRPWPLYTECGGDAALLEAMDLGGPVPRHFALRPAREAAAIVTGRFHGLLFGLQLGKPVFVVSSRPKVVNFLAEHGLLEWRVDEDRPDELVARWPAFVRAWPELRERALRLRDQLVSEVRQAADPARDRLLAAAAALPPPSRRWRSRLQRLVAR